MARALAGAAVAASLSGLTAEAAGEDAFPKPDSTGTVEVALSAKATTLVLLLSGDGGWWGDLDAQLARTLAEHGYAVVGVDTSVWFDEERSRSEIASHVSELLIHYGRRTGATHYVLAGYSFGADMVPLAYNQMAASLRRSVSGFVLIAPERTTTTQVTLSERTGLDPGDVDLAPEFAKLPAQATLCVYGADEADDSGCTLPGLKRAQRVMLPGGHHFDNDPEHLGQIVLRALNRRAPP